MRRAFTLIELIAVIVILAVLAGVAIPRYIDYTARAQYAAQEGTVGAIREAIAMLEMAYVTGIADAGSPPDADSNGSPDHLGDVALGELTLFDGVLDPPMRPSDGWKQWPTFPAAGVLYMYFYDANDNGVWDGSATEAILFYNSSTGQFTAILPPPPP